ncbi:hydroxyacid dehydrogenase [Sodalis sp. RH21]|uniref:hydroxyacid dehydrogenase n=1 Tax=unclassified Sodalis (in: enterobacteria) TaxID=2636512 RepID=UPI0039B45518
MEKYCLIPQPIHSGGLDKLRENGVEPLVGEAACNNAPADRVVAAIWRSGQFSRTQMMQLPALCTIGVHGVGVDGIDVQAASDLGIVVFNTPGTNTRSVAEHTLGLIFALTKRIPAADRAMRTGNYAFRFQGGLSELRDATLGVIGFGAIGQATAQLARAMGMRVQVLSRRGAGELAAAGLQKAQSLATLLGESDVVSLHLPSVPETHKMIGAPQLALMKPGAFLVNTSRGALVDEPALIDALRRGAIAGAGLDVFCHEPVPAGDPLLALENVIVTPHIAASTEQAMMAMANASVQGILDILNQRLPASPINPEIWDKRRRRG